MSIKISDIRELEKSLTNCITSLEVSRTEGFHHHYLKFLPVFEMLQELEGQLEREKIKVTEVKKEFEPLDPAKMREALLPVNTRRSIRLRWLSK